MTADPGILSIGTGERVDGRPGGGRASEYFYASGYFYASVGYAGGARDGDSILLARRDGAIVAAGRPFEEEGALVLRGMHAAAEGPDVILMARPARGRAREPPLDLGLLVSRAAVACSRLPTGSDVPDPARRGASPRGAA